MQKNIYWSNIKSYQNAKKNLLKIIKNINFSCCKFKQINTTKKKY